jgi:predicted Fe-Mo cluster-binding NifX family protein
MKKKKEQQPMIIAIPMNDDRIANHFSKADNFLFINEQGEEISRHINPIYNAHCAGKNDLLELFGRQHAERIVVRNIGKQMLGKLLAHRFAVFQTNCGRHDIFELANPEAAGLNSLTDAEQGRPSSNHEEKNNKRGCRHNNKEILSKQGHCCQQRADSSEVLERHHHKDGHNAHNRGRGRCGHGESRGHHCCRNTPV